MNQNLNNNNTPLTYKQAIEELEQIVQEIEGGDLDLDDLLKKVDRATSLISYCKAKLKHSESQLNELMKKLEDNKE